MTSKRSSHDSQRTAQSLSDAMNVHSQTVMNGLDGVEPYDPDLYEDHLRKLLDLVTCMAVLFLRKLGAADPQQAAEDVRQEWGLGMFPRGFRSFLRNANGRPFAPFGFRALWRKCDAYVRKLHAERYQDVRWEYVDPRRDPAVEAEYQEVLNIVAEEVQRLPPGQRDAILLTVWDGLSAKAAAEILGTSETGIHSRTHRGRANLAKQLRKRNF